MRASFVALVRDAQGEVVGKISREFQRQISPHDAAKVAMDHISYMEPLALPRGDYAIEIAVSDEFSRKASVRRVAFPRESRTGLDLSSLAIVERAEPLVGAANPLNPFDLDKTGIVPELGDTVPSGPVVLYFVLLPGKAGEARTSPRHVRNSSRRLLADRFPPIWVPNADNRDLKWLAS